MEIELPNQEYAPGKLRWSFSLRTLFWVITVFLLSLALCLETRQKQVALQHVRRLKESIFHHLTVHVDYGRITLFRIDGEVYALRITGPPTNATQRFTYEWMRLADWQRSTSTNDKEWSEAVASHPEDALGNGFVDESIAATVILMDPLTIDWSYGSQSYGWLYLSEAKQSDRIHPVEFDVYPVQIDNLSELKLLRDEAWRPVRPVPQ